MVAKARQRNRRAAEPDKIPPRADTKCVSPSIFSTRTRKARRCLRSRFGHHHVDTGEGVLDVEHAHVHHRRHAHSAVLIDCPVREPGTVRKVRARWKEPTLTTRNTARRARRTSTDQSRCDGGYHKVLTSEGLPQRRRAIRSASAVPCSSAGAAAAASTTKTRLVVVLAGETTGCRGFEQTQQDG